MVIIGGYKGYGLGMLVEIFCGILADAEYANNIRAWKKTDRIANLVNLKNMWLNNVTIFTNSCQMI